MKRNCDLILRIGGQITLLLLTSLTTFSQVRNVSGTVTDSSNAPLSNVSVQVKGTKNGTTTNASGNFSLTVPSTNAVLVFSFTGMGTQEATVGNQGSMHIQLRSTSGTLNEVVVIGYGTARKSDLTGSVATVRSEKLLDKPVQKLILPLQL